MVYSWQNFWVGNDQFVIRDLGDTFELVKFTEVNYDEYEKEVIATGSYKEVRKIVDNEYAAYLESLL